MLILTRVMPGCTVPMHSPCQPDAPHARTAQLDWIWGNYTTPPVVPVAGCDAACLAACRETLQWAIYSEKQQDCPTQDAIIACFHVRRRAGRLCRHCAGDGTVACDQP